MQREGGGAAAGPVLSRLEKIAAAILVLARLWLVRSQSLLAIGDSPGDDRLYLQVASELTSGSWLGAYRSLTLAKNPFYPMWVGATYALDVPLLLAQHLLYSAACAVTAIAVRPVLPGRRWAWAVFVALLFNPTGFADQVMTRAAREGIYPALALLVFAGCAGVATLLRDPGSRVRGWAAVLGVSTGALLLTREEGIWILPALVVTAAAAIQRPFPRRRAAAAALLAAGLAGAMVGAVLWKNWRHYGVAVLNEQNGGAFPRAYGAVSRVRHAQWRRYVPVPRETRARIYAVSPRFAELAASIEGPDQGAWVAPGCRWFGICDDVYTGLFLWNMRAAASHAGYFRTGRDAAAFWDALADEVNAACDDGRLECGPPRSTLVPPWRAEYLGLVLDAVRRGALYIARFEGVTARPTPSAGPLPLVEIFRDLSRERLAGIDAQRRVMRVAGWATPVGGEAVDLRLEAPGFPREHTQVERGPRPDLAPYLASRGLERGSADRAGFTLSGYCPAACEVVVSAAGQDLARIPIEDTGKIVERSGVAVAVDEARVEGALPRQESLDEKRLAVLERVIALYRWCTPVLVVAALAAWILAGLRAARRRGDWAPWLVAAGVLAAFGSRLLVLSVVDAMAFTGINVLYLSAAYPFLVAFVPLGLASAWPRRRPTAASADPDGAEAAADGGRGAGAGAIALPGDAALGAVPARSDDR